MNRHLLLAALAFTTTTALAQKEYTPLADIDEMTLLGPADLYRHLDDTLKGKPAMRLKKDEEVIVLGQANHRWATIKRQGFPYFLRQSLLTGSDQVNLAMVQKWRQEPMPIDPETKQFTYQAVKEVPGVSKNDLYSRGFEWVAQTYNSAQNVVQMQDKEAGKIIIKALTTVHARGYRAGTVRYTLSLYFKDGRYKYVLTDFSHEAPALANDLYSGGALENEEPKVTLFNPKKVWTDIRSSAAGDARRLIRNLEAAMTLKGAKDPSDF